MGRDPPWCPAALLQPLRASPVRDHLAEVFHSALVHDGMYGTVLAAATSFDDCYLLSAGADGGFFVQRIQTARPKALAEPPALQAREGHSVSSYLGTPHEL